MTSDPKVTALMERLLASGDPAASLQSLAAQVGTYPDANNVIVGKNGVEFKLGAGVHCTEFELAPGQQPGSLVLVLNWFDERLPQGVFPFTAAMARAIELHKQHSDSHQ